MLTKLTLRLLKTYRKCNLSANFDDIKLKVVLTNPSEGLKNEGYDNENYDLIVSVGDKIISQQSFGVLKTRIYIVEGLLGKGSYGQVYFKKYIYIVVIGCKMSI
jgi:dual specificity protein kinase YAK1